MSEISSHQSATGFDPFVYMFFENQHGKLNFTNFKVIISFLFGAALIAEAKSVFDEFDKDSSGEISAQELGTALRMLGLNPTGKEILDMINEIDENGR